MRYHQWGNTFGAQSAALSLCRETFEVVTNFSRVLSNLLNFAHREEPDKCWEVFVEAATKAFLSTDKFLSFSELLYNLLNTDLNETLGSFAERKNKHKSTCKTVRTTKRTAIAMFTNHSDRSVLII